MPPDQTLMDPLDVRSHSFIIKIWVEETAEEAGCVVWRGSVTHVPSGDKKYFCSFRAMQSHMRVYVADLGINNRWLDQVSMQFFAGQSATECTVAESKKIVKGDSDHVDHDP